jgi:DNA-binding beta-propeller fold protein YncE
MCLLAGPLLPLSSFGGMILASFSATDEVRKFDSVTGADLGVFASGIADPSGIAFDPLTMSVYVANFGANTILKYTAEGSYVGTFGSGLSGPDEMAVDAFGNVYVANYNGFNVKKFNSSGTLLTTFSTSGRPEGMSFAPNGDLLVNIYTGTFANTIRRYDSTGAFVNTFASGGGLNNPYGVVQDIADNIYVSNLTGSSILKYSPGGTLLDSVALGHNGYDITINELGELLASDPSGNRIRRFDLDLNLIGTFATTAAAPTYLAFIPEPTGALVLLVAGLGAVSARRRRP